MSSNYPRLEKRLQSLGDVIVATLIPLAMLFPINNKTTTKKETRQLQLNLAGLRRVK